MKQFLIKAKKQFMNGLYYLTASIVWLIGSAVVVTIAVSIAAVVVRYAVWLFNLIYNYNA